MWLTAHAERAALLLDGAAYFDALRSALLQARRSVIIVGWDIDSRVRLRGADQSTTDDGPEDLRDFLEYLVERRQDLAIHLLLWDYSILYALEREPLPALNLDWRTPSRVVVKLDDALPMGASHHQKIVVIDDTLAFCGGIDLTVNRWDTPDHEPRDPRRKGPSGKTYGPFHDAQLVVDGEAAACLGELVRERWRRATDDELEAADVEPIWPEGVEPDFEAVEVGVARTLPADDDQSRVTEVRRLYLESIRQAERYIYIENQYLTVDAVAEELAARLREIPGLEVVIVTPRRPHGWLETKTMGVGQARFMAQFDGDLRARVRFCYPSVSTGDEDTAIMVHSKLMIVDDRLLRVGSSNLNNRSMGLDSECDLAIEAQDDDHRRGIRDLLCRLLSHHTGREPQEAARQLDERGSLIGTIDALNQTNRGLRKLDPASDYDDLLADTLNIVADRETPIDPSGFVGDMFAATPRQSAMKRAIRLILGAGLLASLVFLWSYTPLADWTDPDKIAAALEAFRTERLAIPILLAAFLVGGLVLFPLTVLITVTGMVLGPWWGFVCAAAGSLASGATGYAIGHAAGRGTLSHVLGRRFRKIKRAVGHRGLVTVTVLRMVPVAPYTVVNVALGAIGVGFWPYMAGTFLGLLPGILALTILGDRLLQAWQHPDPSNVAWFVAAIVIWLSLALGLQKLTTRMKES